MTSLRPVLEVRHLRAVEAIFRARSVTAAAATLNMSQSALSHQLLNLERDLGVALFNRVGKRMIPTVAAERLLSGGRRVLAELEATEAALRGNLADRRRPFRIGAGCVTLYPWLAAQLGEFSATRADTDPRLVFDVRGREAEALANHDADVVITSRPPDDRRLRREQLFALETVAVVGRSDCLAEGNGVLRWSDLAGRSIFMHDLTPQDEADLRIAAGRHGRPPRLVPVQLTEAIFALARTGQGVGLLSRWPDGVGPGMEGVRCMSFRPAHVRTFFAIWRDGGEAADLAADFAKLVQPSLRTALAS